jgi:hypothetical protein
MMCRVIPVLHGAPLLRFTKRGFKKMSTITDEERAGFEKGKAQALAKWDREHPDLEGSFRAANIARGIEPSRAAVMAKNAVKGRVYEPRGF